MKKFFIFICFMFLAALIAVAFFIFGYMACESSYEYQRKSQIIMTISSEKLWKLVNDWRFSKGFQKLKEDANTCNLASTRVLEIQNDFSHNKFMKHSKDFFSYKIGENLSDGYNSEEIILNNWTKSASHSANLSYPYTNGCMRCLNNKCVNIFAAY